MQGITGSGPQLSRRRLLGLGAAGLAGALSAACTTEGIKESISMAGQRQSTPGQETARQGRLLARPAQSPAGSSATANPPRGLQPLGLDAERDGLVYVPAGYRADQPAPLVLMLHGAGGTAEHALHPLRSLADEAGLILLAPDSRRQTWDRLLGGYGPDIAFIDRALAQTFARYAVDPAHLAIEGFSDGASYALSVGMTNGDLFTHVLAFSPGFAAPAGQRGSPRLFISHGIHDEVLPINACSRRIVPVVERAGYDLVYREFDGPHTIPPEIAHEALAWFTADGG